MICNTSIAEKTSNWGFLGTTGSKLRREWRGGSGGGGEAPRPLENF